MLIDPRFEALAQKVAGPKQKQQAFFAELQGLFTRSDSLLFGAWETVSLGRLVRYPSAWPQSFLSS
jgi:hypothetical protein